MQKEVNTDLKTYIWLLANKISLNCSKTEIIFFHKTREKTPDIKIKMNGHRIYPSTNIKYLGVYLQSWTYNQWTFYNFSVILYHKQNGSKLLYI